MEATASNRKVDSSGRDELNIAEWPNGLLSKRPSRDVKTRVFEDTFGSMKRSVTITGSDKYGLPGYKEDEVLFGLVNVTRERNGLKERTVQFKRSDLVRTLGWPDKGSSWRAIDHALNVIAGTLCVYENAWYEKNSTRKKFVNRKFHMIDHVELVSESPDGGALYTITWGHVIFESFKCGSIKSIDLDFWRELRSPVAKRLFRFLDKQFWNSDLVRYDLVSLGVHKLGMREGIDVAQIKRSLAPGIRELEEKKFLKRLPVEKRFRKLCAGRHEVIFERERAIDCEEVASLPLDCLGALVERGVAKERAKELVSSRSKEEILAAISDFDERKKRGGLKSNPGGWLFTRLRDGARVKVGEASPLEELAARGRARKQEAKREREEEAAKARAEEEALKQSVDEFLRQISIDEARGIVIDASAGQKFLSREEALRALEKTSRRGPLWYLTVAREIEKRGGAERLKAAG